MKRPFARAVLLGVAASAAAVAAFGTTAATFSAAHTTPALDSASVPCTRYLDAVNATGPQILWNGDRRTTSTVHDDAAADGDDAGELRDGLQTNQPTDRCGGAFDAPADSPATLVGTSRHTNPQSMTLAVWVKQTHVHGGRLLGFVETRDSSDIGNNDRTMWVNRDGFVFGLNAGGAPRTVGCNTPLLGSWHHLVVTVSSTNGTRLYLDGLSCASDATMNAPLPYSGYWRLGSAFLWWWPGVHAQGWPGPVENAAIWDRELTTTEVHNIYDAANTPALGNTPFERPTTMWVWDNNVPAATDGRGTGYAPADPTVLAQFATDHHLSTVYVTAPWAADDGSPLDDWLNDTVAELRTAGVADVGVVGGGPDWLDDPNLAVLWMGWALADRPVNHVQLEIEPWSGPAYANWVADRPGSIARWLTAIDAAKAALPAGVTFGVAAPYWLVSETAPGGGTLMDAVLDRVDSVSIIAYVDHADGLGGILTLAAPAVDAAVAKGVPFTIAVETDSPAIAGGPEFTFGDDSPEVLDQQVTIINGALANSPGYRGVAVEHYRTWRTLLGE